jgi:homogentisate 1,2-dioxygenase
MNTTYFDEMTFNCAAYERAKKEREERKAQIAKVHGYNSPEMDAWYAEDKAAGPYPYSAGEMKAYWVFKFRRENNADEFEMSDYCWDKEFHDFVETLRKLGITEFTVTTQSTGLMEDLYGYAEFGCTMVGLHSITKKCPYWLGEDHQTVKGIRFKVN